MQRKNSFFVIIGKMLIGAVTGIILAFLIVHFDVVFTVICCTIVLLAGIAPGLSK